MKIRAIIDTNVVVSGILTSNSPPAAIIDAWIQDKFESIISADLEKEIRGVLQRPKVRKRIKNPGDVEVVLKLIFKKSLSFKPKVGNFPSLPDLADRFLFDLAVAANAEVIVTGDKALLEMKPVGKMQVINPREFVGKLGG